MIRLILPFAALLGGCIIYDTDGKCKGCTPEEGMDDGPDEDPADDTATENGGETGSETGSETGGETGSETGGTDTGGDTGEPVNTDLEFTLDPNQAAAGTTFIAHLDTPDEAFDWGAVVEVTFYGGVEVLAMDEDDGELDLALRVPQDAQPGSADLLLVDKDGQAYFAYDILTIVAP